MIKSSFKKILLLFVAVCVLGLAMLTGLFAYYFPACSVVLQPIGGMGNQMFQYAAAYSLAKSTGSKLYVLIDKESERKGNISTIDRNSALTQFRIPEEQIVRDDGVARMLVKMLKRVKFADKIFRITNIDESNFIKNKTPSRGRSFVMRSYFESEEFFAEHQNEIRQIFDVDSTRYALILADDTLNGKRVGVMEELVAAENSVCVHVRRGDALGLLSITIDYQKEAMDLVKKLMTNPKFYIFSDDVELVKKELSTESNIVYANRADSIPMEDFYLMSKCAANINSNSTFSWWAAYLNLKQERLVIAPYPRFSDAVLQNTVAPAEVDVWRGIINGSKSYPANWLLVHYLEDHSSEVAHYVPRLSLGDLTSVVLCDGGNVRPGVCYSRGVR